MNSFDSLMHSALPKLLEIVSAAGREGISIKDIDDSTLQCASGYFTAVGQLELMESQDEYYRVRINENFKSDN